MKRGYVPALPKKSHSTRFSNKGYHCSSKAARGEDLQVEWTYRIQLTKPEGYHV